MYYNDCDGGMQNNPKMQGGMCPAMVKGQCPAMQNYYNPAMMQNNMPGVPGCTMPMMQQNMLSHHTEMHAERQLEMMYPHSYYVIFPHVRQQCDILEQKHGKIYCPTKEELKGIIEDICDEVEKELEEDDNKHRDDYRNEERRPRGRYTRRRLLNDLIGVILIEELLGRRRPYYYGPGYWY
ncbi:hypothetical protein [Clostridium thermarum]|uniref:hypothetical protein n=1 Tax=Clostridium thermarum TaxID=1716543 RepID=UPI0013D753C2|nr:hypothetical protein [Clostridium thermarum]